MQRIKKNGRDARGPEITQRPALPRIPQLTFADDHPGEDLPAFHFAFEMTPGNQRAELAK